MDSLYGASWSGDRMEDVKDLAKLGASAAVGAGIAVQVTEIKMLKDLAGGYVAPIVPIAVGFAIHSYGKSQYPVAAPGVAAGMVAVGLGKLVGKLLDLAGNPAGVKSFVPFAGVDTYDSALEGLGYSYGAGVDAYMSGSPTQVQAISGMPVQIQTLRGLGSTIVGGSAPLSASLM